MSFNDEQYSLAVTNSIFQNSNNTADIYAFNKPAGTLMES